MATSTLINLIETQLSLPEFQQLGRQHEQGVQVPQVKRHSRQQEILMSARNSG